MIALKYLILCVVLLTWLSGIGYPIRRLLDRPDGSLAPVPAPFLGMAVVQLVGWYWLEAGRVGLRVPTVGLTIVAVTALVATVIRDHRRGRHADRRRQAMCGATLVGAALVLGLNFSAVLGLGYVTTADSGNNDATNYAVFADHLARSDFNTDGHIVGYDMGFQTRVNGFGSTVVLGLFAAATGQPAFKLNEAVLFTFAALSVYSLSLLLSEILPGREVLAIAVSVAASCTLLFIYIVNLFFLGQLMAMGVLPLLAVVGLRAAEPMPGRDRIRLLIASSALFFVLASHYSHMAILAPPIVVPAAVLASPAARLTLRTLWQRSIRIALVVGGGAAVAVVIAPVLVSLGLTAAMSRGTAAVGWPLPGFLPVELMGFMRQVTPHQSIARMGWSVIILGVFVACAWLARGTHRIAVRFSAAAAALILVSYLLLYHREGGPSYRQWKWITFFQPLFVALVLVVILLGVGVVLGRRWHGPTAAVVCAGALSFAVIVSTNTGDGPGTAQRDRRQLQVADRDDIDLRTNPALSDVDQLNISTGSYWDAMWATYFLADKAVRLQDQTYWSLLPPAPGWTLIPTSVNLSGDTVRPVNRSYQLLYTDGAPTSTTPTGLDAAVDVTIDRAPTGAGVLTGTARVTNTGTTAWLPSDGELGSVNLGVRLADAAGAITNDEYGRIALNPKLRTPIPPHTTVTVPFSIPTPPDPTAQLVFQPVAELVTWFGPQVRATGAPPP